MKYDERPIVALYISYIIKDNTDTHARYGQNKEDKEDPTLHRKNVKLQEMDTVCVLIGFMPVDVCVRSN